MENQKYKLVRSRFPFSDYLSWDGEHFTVYRIKALRDIPEHNVKKGDLGGFVSNKFNLSQTDSCWIASNAKVVGNVFITENAHIDNSAVVICPHEDYFIEISGDVSIRHSAMVSFDPKLVGSPGNHSSITGKTIILGSAQVRNVNLIEGNVRIQDRCRITCASFITGDVTVAGKADIEGRVKLSGKTYITDNSIVEYGATVIDSNLFNDARVYGDEVVEKETRGGYPHALVEAGEALESKLLPENHVYASYNKDYLYDFETELRLSSNPEICAMDFSDVIRYLNGIMEKNSLTSRIYGYDLTPKIKSNLVKIAPAKAATLLPDDVEITDALNLLNEIKQEIHAYESDIVKIIQYPVMTDKTNPFTLEMTAALKRANRLSVNPSHNGFVASVFELEKKFIAAEANALRIASTHLSELEKKKTDKAKDLLSMAADEASSDNEKELAFTQAFKQLEGIIFVPEVAVDTFRVKIGLKELESKVKENA